MQAHDQNGLGESASNRIARGGRRAPEVQHHTDRSALALRKDAVELDEGVVRLEHVLVLLADVWRGG